MSSRRSSAASRRGYEEAGWRKEERVEEKFARMMSLPLPANHRLEPLTNQKQRLPPLVELIEPTPPLCRNTPIFGLTGLDDNEFDIDISDINSEMSEDLHEGSSKRTTAIKIPNSQFLNKDFSEQKRSKKKLIDNVNSYL